MTTPNATGLDCRIRQRLARKARTSASLKPHRRRLSDLGHPFAAAQDTICCVSLGVTAGKIEGAEEDLAYAESQLELAESWPEVPKAETRRLREWISRTRSRIEEVRHASR